MPWETIDIRNSECVFVASFNIQAHASYYIVIWGLSGSIIFFNITYRVA